MKSLNRIAILLCVLFSVRAGADVGTLSLDQYLRQVQGGNEGYQGSAVSAQADQVAAKEADFNFAYQAFGTFQYTDDRRQTIVPLFEGTRTVTDATQVGVKKLFDFGLQTQLSYGITQNTIYGVSPELVPQTSLITSALTLTVTQPLWQNGFGKQDDAQRRITEAQDLQKSYTSAYETKTLLADVETRYWTLAIAREVIVIQQKSLDRTTAIRDFNKKRVRAHLIDTPDLLTSEAQVKSKQFDLKTAIDNERVAARAFNSARGIDSDVVNETLMSLAPEALQALEVPARSEFRDDVKAAEQSSILATANSDLSTQKQQPALNVTGTVSSNGLDPSLNTSVHDTLTTNNPYYQFGLNFTVPLDFGTVSEVKRAYAQQMKGAELTYKRKLFDQENDWKDLVRKFKEAKERLAIAVEVENAEKSKYDHESTRQKQGVTTTYQVFQFDLDYLTSELNRVQTQAIILNLLAQMKTYRSGT